MDGPSAMRQCLIEMDVEGIRQLWHLIAPKMPQPKTDREAMETMHYARTLMGILPLRSRYYSHRWLLDHNIVSGLPDEMKPAAERMFPQVVSGVGLSVNTNSELLKPVMPVIRSAMENAIHEAYADGRKDDILHIKRRMAEARKTVVRKLLGVR